MAEVQPEQLIVTSKGKPQVTTSAGEYLMPDSGLISFQLPEQVGYAGLIIANGGLQGSDNSYLMRHHGIRLGMWLGENEDYNVFHRGDHAGLFTSADYLAAYGGRLNVVAVGVPLFYGFDDFLIARRKIQTIPDLVGETIVVPQYTIADFFIRDAVTRCGLKMHFRDGLDSPLESSAVNFVFTVQVDHAAEVFELDLHHGTGRLAGCSAWDPMNQEVVQKSSGYAHYLTDQEARTIVADVLVLNRPFVERNPDLVRGIVQGLLHGNAILNSIKAKAEAGLDEEAIQILESVAEALTDGRPDAYSKEEVLELMKDCDYPNYAMTRAYFENRMARGMSFQEHFRSACDVFEFGKTRGDEYEKFILHQFLDDLEPKFSDSIHELSVHEGFAEAEPLWRPVEVIFEKRKLTEVNLDLGTNRVAIKQILDYLKWNETAFVRLTGYLSGSRRDSESQMEGGIVSRAQSASLTRANAVRDILTEAGISQSRIETEGMGWGDISDNRVTVEMIELE